MDDQAASGSSGAQPLSAIATIRNKRGLHARAAAKFVQVSGGFKAAINVSKGTQTVSGNSIMGLMMLAAGPGCEIEISASGADAQAALDAITALIDAKFDEE